MNQSVIFKLVLLQSRIAIESSYSFILLIGIISTNHRMFKLLSPYLGSFDCLEMFKSRCFISAALSSVSDIKTSPWPFSLKKLHFNFLADLYWVRIIWLTCTLLQRLVHHLYGYKYACRKRWKCWIKMP